MILDLLRGGLAGFAATLPMTAAMVAWHRRLPRRQRYPLPPRQITMEVARRAGVKDDLSEEQMTAATLAAHFSYGSAAGATYAALIRSRTRPGIASGIGYGLGVWAVSYLGLLPATGLLSPATEHPGRRNALMIAAHVAWGACLGGLMSLMQHGSQREREELSNDATMERDDVAGSGRAGRHHGPARVAAEVGL